jgi:hypothetical protein
MLERIGSPSVRMLPIALSMAVVRSAALALAFPVALSLSTACGHRTPSGVASGTGETSGKMGIACPQGESVERYGDEATLGLQPATLVQSTVAHTAADGGSQVTLLLGGTEIVQVAERGRAILVSFPDPADTSQQKMGWIPVSALRPVVPSRCPEGQTRTVTTLGIFCATLCRNADDCAEGETCVAGGNAAATPAAISNRLSYCISR